jgi:hypothetical protein
MHCLPTNVLVTKNRRIHACFDSEKEQKQLVFVQYACPSLYEFSLFVRFVETSNVLLLCCEKCYSLLKELAST